MTKFRLVLCSLLLAGTCFFPGTSGRLTADDAPNGVFPYRAWAFSIHSQDWEVVERYVNDALLRAEAYGINTIELHDYSIGRRGIVEMAITYRDFSKLQARKTLNYRGEVIGFEARERDYPRFRALAQKIKAAGLKLNVWYHVMRDVPAELAVDYPEIKDLDSGRMWEYLDKTLREFFERVPEVDRLVITSLAETPSVMSNKGSMSREDRLLKLYQTIYGACHDNDKELVIRDFLVKRADYESFFKVLDQLPPDIYIMTKEILGDWTHLGMPPNPYFNQYVNRKLIVEFDLYGEFWGRMSVPCCYPRYLFNMMHIIRAAGAEGAVGRVVHDAQTTDIFQTIFESPNEINCYAFAHYLSHPFPWMDDLTSWDSDVDAFDESIWTDWAGRRYGKKAAVPLIRAFKRTEQIIPLMFDVGGLRFQEHSALPHPRRVAFYWSRFANQLNRVGIDYLRDEKKQACEMVQQCLDDIESAKDDLSENDYRQLRKLFEGELLVAQAFQALLEGYYQLALMQQSPNLEGLKAAAERMNSLADKIVQQRGNPFQHHLAPTLRAQAKFILKGQVPGK
ncbi:MAG: hypothetical protein JXB10_09700 [Pirellulales bacterium]|nr:hypothetical protein [Pirellulales bacterium]